MAHAYALVAAADEVGTEEIEEHIWDCVAYATRYGKGVGLREALQTPYHELTDFLRALSRIVGQEAEAKGKI